MNLKIPLLQAGLAKSRVLSTMVAALAALGTYTCMYAFRKGFAAGTFQLQFWHIDYKVWLVMAQVIGYMLSKFYGIRFIASMTHEKRPASILLMIGIAWLSMLGFALIPAPWNILCLFMNGLPLGMIWGIVFSYLEGRRTTELTGTVMATSFIFASGLVKTTGKYLMASWHVSEYWMPFVVGALFALPLVVFIVLLEQVPAPAAADIAQRAPRLPMTKQDRRNLVRSYLPGLVLTIAIYLLLTVVRDLRDNFEVEIWTSLGFGSQPAIYSRTDVPVAFGVMALMSLLMLVRRNITAFMLIHLMVFAGCLLAGVATLLYDAHLIGAVGWMSLAGLGLYMAYVPYNCIFFERMIAVFRISGNVGFIMYLADASGYLGSVSVLFFKQFSPVHISWLQFFHSALQWLSLLGMIAVSASLIYFRGRYSRDKKPSFTSNTIYA